ncbi:hypothetical protein G7Y89_g12541 [Cudoniella acicularis]|uniref:Uncharacterized protein n=1 Tax=Cudoniella acicularis TaxID=354080 RepID=A0A8H4R8L5_9HELO|nr:hypothetical protein G7Y89_g12541 [Cudoniella acicularis]
MPTPEQWKALLTTKPVSRDSSSSSLSKLWSNPKSKKSKPSSGKSTSPYKSKFIECFEGDPGYVPPGLSILQSEQHRQGSPGSSESSEVENVERKERDPRQPLHPLDILSLTPSHPPTQSHTQHQASDVPLFEDWVLQDTAEVTNNNNSEELEKNRDGGTEASWDW